MPDSRVTFVGDAMAAVVQGIIEVRNTIGQPPVIVGGLAVLSRLSQPYRATIDLDIVDRMRGDTPQLEVLRAVDTIQPIETAAVTIDTAHGKVKVDVLEVRQVELDMPSDDPGDRLHASAHAWAHDSATNMTIEVVGASGGPIMVTTPIAEPGPLVAMKLQAVMNRSTGKQGTDLLDIVRLSLDHATRKSCQTQIGAVDSAVAEDMERHVDLWFVQRRSQTLQRIRAAGGSDVLADDVALVSELLLAATKR